MGRVVAAPRVGRLALELFAAAMEASGETLARCIATLDRTNATLVRSSATLTLSDAPLCRCNGAMGRYLATRRGDIASVFLARFCQEGGLPGSITVSLAVSLEHQELRRTVLKAPRLRLMPPSPIARVRRPSCRTRRREFTLQGIRFAEPSW